MKASNPNLWSSYIFINLNNQRLNQITEFSLRFPDFMCFDEKPSLLILKRHKNLENNSIPIFNGRSQINVSCEGFLCYFLSRL